MGEVYRARDTRLKREVALKVLPDAVASDRDRMARFQREAELLASLNHPNIAQIYGVEERALAMEFVEGASPRGPMPFVDAWKIALQIADALDYAHERGVIHRDLKPDNIIVTPDGQVKLLDFGLAKAMEDRAAIVSDPASSPTMTMNRTMEGSVMGTAGYMAPEQARGRRVDKRADIWAWGVVFWELLTGERLFMGEDVAQTIVNVLTREPDLQKAPPQARKLLGRVLEKDPKLRLRDIGEVRHLIASQETAPVPATRSRYANAGWIAAAVLGIVAAVLAYFAFRPPNETAPTHRLSILPPEKASFSTTYNIPALSPDGRHVAVVAGSRGRTALWVRSLHSLNARLLPGTEEARYPFWSPDSASIGFFAGNKLKRISADGGPAITICDAAGFGGTWNSKDVIVFAPSATGGLSSVAAGGGDPAPFTQLKRDAGEISHRFPSFLPDGRHVLFTTRNVNTPDSTVSMADLKAKSHKAVLKTVSRAVFAPPNLLLFLRAQERTLMAVPFDADKGEIRGEATPIAEDVVTQDGIFAGSQFSVSGNGVLTYIRGVRSLVQLTWYDRAGTVRGTAGKPIFGIGISLSPDEKRVAVDRRDQQSNRLDIWTLNLEDSGETRLTFGDGDSLRPVWSGDGTRIAFTNNRKGVEEIYVKTFGASSDELLDKGEFGARISDWSRDGRYILERRASPKTTFDIWALPTFGDRKPFPVVETDMREDEPRLSPDGQFLAYDSTDTGEEVYVSTFPQPGRRWQISSGGGRFPVWARDGRAVYYAGFDGMMTEVKVTPGPNPTFGKPTPLFEARLPAPMQYAVSSKGLFLIPTLLDDPLQVPLTVVVNWQAGLKR